MSEFKLKQTAEEVQKAIDDASTPSDWNQTDSSAADFIKNKPFGESYGDTLYFDGNTEGLEYIDAAGDGSFLFVRLCDTVVTKEDVANGYSFMAHMNETVTGTFDGETAQSAFQDNGFGSLADAALVFPYDGFDLDGITIAKAGVYTLVSNGRGVPFSITIPGYTGFPVTKKIEEKFIPTSVKADKGPIVLYMDDEKYLYAEVGTNLNADYDTSDTTKRITQGDLKGFLASGRAIYFLYGEYKDTYVPAWIKWRGEYGTAGFNVVVNDVSVDIVAYTAEYTS